MIRQCRTRRGRAGHCMVRQGMARQGRAKAERDMARYSAWGNIMTIKTGQARLGAGHGVYDSLAELGEMSVLFVSLADC